MHVQIENSCKKEQKCIFNFEIHTKKGRNEKNKALFFWFFFAFISPVPIIAFLTSKFSNSKNICKRKVENNISKNIRKKCKKARRECIYIYYTYEMIVGIHQDFGQPFIWRPKRFWVIWVQYCLNKIIVFCLFFTWLCNL